MNSVTHGAPRFPLGFPTDTGFVEQAMQAFLRQSGYAPNCPFTDLTTLEQRTVLHLALKLKQEAAK